MNGTAAIFESDRRFALVIVALTLVCLQGLAVAAALALGWYWVFVPWVVIFAATAFLVPRVGVLLLAMSLYFKFSLPGMSSVYPADALAMCIVAGTITGRLIQGRRLFESTPLNKPILLILAIFALSLINAYALNSGIVNWLRHLQLFGLCIAVTAVMEIDDIERLLRWMLLITSVLALLNVAEFILIGGSKRVFGPLGSYFPLFLSVAIGQCAVHALLTERSAARAGWTSLALLLFMAQLASQARAAWLQAVLSLGIMVLALWKWTGWTGQALVRRRLVLVVFVTALVMVILLSGLLPVLDQPMNRIYRTFAGESFTMQTRLFLWKTGLDAFLASPILGTGLGQVKQWHEFIPSWRFDPLSAHSRGLGAHNDSITYLSETGLVGFAAILWFFFRLMRFGYRSLMRVDRPEDARRILVLWVPVAGIVTAFFFGTHTFYSLAGMLTALYFGMLAKVCSASSGMDTPARLSHDAGPSARGTLT